MASAIEIKKAERAELIKENGSILAAVEKAGEFTDAQRERLGEIETSLPAIDSDIELLQKARERVANAPKIDAPEMAQALGFTTLHPGLGTVADQVFANEAFAHWQKTGISRTGRIESPAVELQGSMFRPSALAPLRGGTGTEGGAFIMNDRTNIYDNALQRRLRLRDLVTIGGTESDTVEFVRTTSVTNNAAGVVEADDVDPTDETGLKPQSTMAFEVVQPGVKTIAHWIAATSNALADARQLRTLIDDFLRYGVAAKVEAQMIGGNGTTELAGLSGTANVLTQAFDTNMLTTTRRAQGKVEYGASADDAEGEPTAYLLNPLDWVDIDLEMTLAGAGTNNRQAGTTTTPTLWGLPVVTSKGVAQGTGYVADWRFAVLWDREQTIIRVGQPNNFFLKNLHAVLAEARAAFGIIRPSAFCEIDLGAS